MEFCSDLKVFKGTVVYIYIMSGSLKFIGLYIVISIAKDFDMYLTQGKNLLQTFCTQHRYLESPQEVPMKFQQVPVQ